MTYTVDDFIEACQYAINNGYKISGGGFINEFCGSCCPLTAMMMKNMDIPCLAEIKNIVFGEESKSRMEEILNMSFDEIDSFWRLFDKQGIVYNWPPPLDNENGLGKEVYCELKNRGML